MELLPFCFLSLLFRSSASSVAALGEASSDLFLHLLMEPPWLFGHALWSEPNVLNISTLQIIVRDDSVCLEHDCFRFAGGKLRWLRRGLVPAVDGSICWPLCPAPPSQLWPPDPTGNNFQLIPPWAEFQPGSWRRKTHVSHPLNCYSHPERCPFDKAVMGHLCHAVDAGAENSGSVGQGPVPAQIHTHGCTPSVAGP